MCDKAQRHRDVSGTLLGPRSRVPEAWQGPGHSKMYGARPVLDLKSVAETYPLHTNLIKTEIQ
jgi:hypothetical protein